MRNDSAISGAVKAFPSKKKKPIQGVKKNSIAPPKTKITPKPVSNIINKKK